MLLLSNSLEDIVQHVQQLSRHISRPLSLFVVNARQIENVLLLRKWLRRVLIYADIDHVFYHFVSSCIGLDLYGCLNLKVRLGNCNSVMNSQYIAWPFDIINIFVSQSNVGLLTKEGYWKLLIKNQRDIEYKYIFILQGDLVLVDKVYRFVNCKVFLKNSLIQVEDLYEGNYTFEGVPSTIVSWFICNNQEVSEQQISQELDDKITDTFIWGDEV